MEHDDNDDQNDVATSTSSSADKNNDDNEKEDEYEVENILKCRLNKNYSRQHRNLPLQQQLRVSNDPKEFDYLVKWKGYPAYEATWEPLQHLTNTREIFNTFVHEQHLPDSWKQDADTAAEDNLDLAMIKFLNPT